jgi:predicted metal-dependent RNase
VDTDEGTIVYTGDINCIDTMVTKAAEEVPCDILVMESTYGSPDFRFPPRDQIYRSLVEWVIPKVREGATPTFYVYPVGKSQEVVSVLNHFTEIPVIVDPPIAKVNEVYSRSRVKLDATMEEGSSQMRHGCVAVKPHQSFNPSGLDPGVIPVMASGWATKFRYRNMIFPLSSHADFYQLMDYVNRVKPKIVYTSFGLSEELAGYIRRRLGVEARPLKPLSRESCLYDHGLG